MLSPLVEDQLFCSPSPGGGPGPTGSIRGRDCRWILRSGVPGLCLSTVSPPPWIEKRHTLPVSLRAQNKTCSHLAVMEENNAKDVWRAALGELELQVTRPYFDTYLKGTVGISSGEGRFTVGAPNAFVTEWLRLKMRPRIEETIQGLTGRPLIVEFLVSSHPGLSPQTFTPSPAVTGGHDDDADTAGAYTPPAGHKSAPLNRNYTFDSMVVARFNRVAHAAAQAVAENADYPFNPLYIYGDVGLGKTHLLHAIGHNARSRHRDMLYVGAEQFTTDYAEAARERDFGTFRRKYREVDLLMVDDIQFIGGKRQTQEGFFHVFNDLHGSNRQLVFAGDRHPRDIEALDPRLVSRFEGGLLADITAPSLDTRVAILRLKCSSMSVDVPGSILDMIARMVDGSVRQLEGALNRVLALAKAESKPVTLALASEALLKGAELTTANTSSDAIIEFTATHFGLSIEEITGKRRLKRYVQARDIAMYLLREELHLTPMRIGALFGDRTPAGVSASCRKVSERAQASKSIRLDIARIRDILFSNSRV